MSEVNEEYIFVITFVLFVLYLIDIKQFLLHLVLLFNEVCVQVLYTHQSQFFSAAGVEEPWMIVSVLSQSLNQDHYPQCITNVYNLSKGF